MTFSRWTSRKRFSVVNQLASATASARRPCFGWSPGRRWVGVTAIMAPGAWHRARPNDPGLPVIRPAQAPRIASKRSRPRPRPALSLIVGQLKTRLWELSTSVNSPDTCTRSRFVRSILPASPHPAHSGKSGCRFRSGIAISETKDKIRNLSNGIPNRGDIPDGHENPPRVLGTVRTRPRPVRPSPGPIFFGPPRPVDSLDPDGRTIVPNPCASFKLNLAYLMLFVCFG